MNDSCPTDAYNRCLYFSANALSRNLDRLAAECMSSTGLSPAHAYLLKLVIKFPGSGPSHLAEVLNLAPSTVTRFVDALERKGLLERQHEGKQVSIFPTNKGENMLSDIEAGAQRLFQVFKQALGEEGCEQLTAAISLANERFEQVP